MNTNIVNNYSKLRLSLFFLPLFFLIVIVLYLYIQDSLSANSYIQIQKDSFYFLNSRLSQYPSMEYNLTQLGDAFVFSSFLAILFISAPKMWESLLSASFLSCIVSHLLKKLFSVPRPAATFDNNSFVIIGKTLAGHNSIPSGHSITVFSMLTILLFAFIPRKPIYKTLWFFFIIITGLVLVFTRVGVGAHYPLDVIIGGIIGYISGLVGIFISIRYKIWNWIGCKKYYPIFMLLFLVYCFLLISKIINENLIIFYLALISLVISLYKITLVYVQK